MAELDKIPQKQTVEFATVKLDEGVVENIQKLNDGINILVSRFGEIYLRKKEINDELVRLEDLLEKMDNEFKTTNDQLRDIVAELDEQYPQGRINIVDGTITYQPGAPSRKQVQEQQAQQSNGSNLKVVKE